MVDVAVPMFERVIAAGDALGIGSVTISKRSALEFFPCADGKTGIKVDCSDDSGADFTVTHRFWAGAKSRVVYVIQGLDALLQRTAAAPGDTLCFKRLASGRVRISVRKPGSKDAPLRGRHPAGTPAPVGRPPKVAKQMLREGVAVAKRKGRGNGRNKEACADWSPLVPGGDAAAAPGQAAVWWAPEQDGVFRAALYGNPGAPTAPQVRNHGGSTWSATVDIDGTLFQAFFSTRAAALAAFAAASGHSAADEAWLEEQQLKNPGGIQFALQ